MYNLSSINKSSDYHQENFGRRVMKGMKIVLVALVTLRANALEGSPARGYLTDKASFNKISPPDRDSTPSPSSCIGENSVVDKRCYYTPPYDLLAPYYHQELDMNPVSDAFSKRIIEWVERVPTEFHKMQRALFNEDLGAFSRLKEFKLRGEDPPPFSIRPEDMPFPVMRGQFSDGRTFFVMRLERRANSEEVRQREVEKVVKIIYQKIKGNNDSWGDCNPSNLKWTCWTLEMEDKKPDWGSIAILRQGIPISEGSFLYRLDIPGNKNR